MIRAAAALLSATLLAGCASLPDRNAPATAGPEAAACTRWFAALDAAVQRHHVRDVEAERVAGFPGLRTDRFAASLRARASTEPALFDAWLARLARLGAEGLGIELDNLPPAAFPLDGADDIHAARLRTAHCTGIWRAPLQSDASLRAALTARATVPDRYVTWQRALGAYALLRGPFHAGVQAWERDHQAQVARWAAAPPPRQRYVAATPTAVRATIDHLWRTRPRDALGLPQFTTDEAALLLAAYAPAIEVETAGGDDRFGPLAWRDDAVPAVDDSAPVLYRRLTATRYRGQTLPQLVYSLWFPARTSRGRFDILAGRLDAVVLRITLAPDDGRPLMVDSIHGCGCYQLFVPTQEVRLRDGAPSDVEWAHLPMTLPALAAGERIVVRIAAATHDVVGVARDAGAPGTAYGLRDERELRRLPTTGGGTRSVFGPDGLVAGSERAERFLYWPMGIASAGAMRQSGHHATAFVGRRHFDDADLIERRFVIPALE